MDVFFLRLTFLSSFHHNRCIRLFHYALFWHILQYHLHWSSSPLALPCWKNHHASWWPHRAVLHCLYSTRFFLSVCKICIDPHFANQMSLQAFIHRRQQLKLIYMFRAIKQIYLIHGEHHLTFSVWTSVPKRFTNSLKYRGVNPISFQIELNSVLWINLSNEIKCIKNQQEKKIIRCCCSVDHQTNELNYVIVVYTMYALSSYFVWLQWSTWSCPLSALPVCCVCGSGALSV